MQENLLILSYNKERARLISSVLRGNPRFLPFVITPQDERYEQRPDGTIRRFRQQTPPAQSTYIPQPPPDEPLRRRKREKRRRRRVWLYVFALIGVAFVAVEIFRYLIVPLLVQLHIWTGGRL